MFALSSAALVGLVLLATPVDVTAPSPLPICETGTRYVELTANAPRAAHEVCIHLGQSTLFIFDSKLAGVELAGRERFRIVEGEVGFALIPREVVDGERVRMTVHFLDGEAPESVTFWLVAHPAQAERQVEVTRHPRTRDSYEEGERQAKSEARQCREEMARVHAACAGQVGLTGLIDERLGSNGVATKNIKEGITARPGNSLQARLTRSYRSDTEDMEGEQKVVRLAVELEVQNDGETPWTPVGAVLLGSKRLKVLGVWSPKPIPPGEKGRVVVEAEATENEVHGSFTLKLWSQEGSTRGEFFDGVTFP